MSWLHSEERGGVSIWFYGCVCRKDDDDDDDGDGRLLQESFSSWVNTLELIYTATTTALYTCWILSASVELVIIAAVW